MTTLNSQTIDDESDFISVDNPEIQDAVDTVLSEFDDTFNLGDSSANHGMDETADDIEQRIRQELISELDAIERAFKGRPLSGGHGKRLVIPSTNYSNVLDDYLGQSSTTEDQENTNRESDSKIVKSEEETAESIVEPTDDSRLIASLSQITVPPIVKGQFDVYSMITVLSKPENEKNVQNVEQTLSQLKRRFTQPVNPTTAPKQKHPGRPSKLHLHGDERNRSHRKRSRTFDAFHEFSTNSDTADIDRSMQRTTFPMYHPKIFPVVIRYQAQTTKPIHMSCSFYQNDLVGMYGPSDVDPDTDNTEPPALPITQKGLWDRMVMLHHPKTQVDTYHTPLPIAPNAARIQPRQHRPEPKPSSMAQRAPRRSHRPSVVAVVAQPPPPPRVHPSLLQKSNGVFIGASHLYPTDSVSLRKERQIVPLSSHLRKKRETVMQAELERVGTTHIRIQSNISLYPHGTTHIPPSVSTVDIVPGFYSSLTPFHNSTPTPKKQLFFQPEPKFCSIQPPAKPTSDKLTCIPFTPLGPSNYLLGFSFSEDNYNPLLFYHPFFTSLQPTHFSLVTRQLQSYREEIERLQMVNSPFRYNFNTNPNAKLAYHPPEAQAMQEFTVTYHQQTSKIEKPTSPEDSSREDSPLESSSESESSSNSATLNDKPKPVQRGRPKKPGRHPLSEKGRPVLGIGRKHSKAKPHPSIPKLPPHLLLPQTDPAATSRAIEFTTWDHALRTFEIVMSQTPNIVTPVMNYLPRVYDFTDVTQPPQRQLSTSNIAHSMFPFSNPLAGYRERGAAETALFISSHIPVYERTSAQLLNTAMASFLEHSATRFNPLQTIVFPSHLIPHKSDPTRKYYKSSERLLPFFVVRSAVNCLKQKLSNLTLSKEDRKTPETFTSLAPFVQEELMELVGNPECYLHTFVIGESCKGKETIRVSDVDAITYYFQGQLKEQLDQNYSSFTALIGEMTKRAAINKEYNRQFIKDRVSIDIFKTELIHHKKKYHSFDLTKPTPLPARFPYPLLNILAIIAHTDSEQSVQTRVSILTVDGKPLFDKPPHHDSGDSSPLPYSLPTLSSVLAQSNLPPSFFQILNNLPLSIQIFGPGERYLFNQLNQIWDDSVVEIEQLTLLDEDRKAVDFSNSTPNLFSSVRLLSPSPAPESSTQTQSSIPPSDANFPNNIKTPLSPILSSNEPANSSVPFTHALSPFHVDPPVLNFSLRPSNIVESLLYAEIMHHNMSAHTPVKPTHYTGSYLVPSEDRTHFIPVETITTFLTTTNHGHEHTGSKHPLTLYAPSKSFSRFVYDDDTLFTDTVFVDLKTTPPEEGPPSLSSRHSTRQPTTSADSSGTLSTTPVLTLWESLLRFLSLPGDAIPTACDNPPVQYADLTLMELETEFQTEFSRCWDSVTEQAKLISERDQLIFESFAE
ncbi:hypothetical protein BLNAU_5811 [Blattamonas nauphoetae]|uniref:Uncharacterized protein n=1 Tax=Blattamonas nauphoetae TaxID=2049346 RepID=A0ABQ9Y6A2_9EUKA|nr:hypothetical protein BLNAU_5811 [Blattamonas nauphoetae]